MLPWCQLLYVPYLINSLQQPSEILLSGLDRPGNRLREVKWLAQVPTASRWKLNPIIPDAKGWAPNHFHLIAPHR